MVWFFCFFDVFADDVGTCAALRYPRHRTRVGRTRRDLFSCSTAGSHVCTDRLCGKTSNKVPLKALLHVASGSLLLSTPGLADEGDSWRTTGNQSVGERSAGGPAPRLWVVRRAEGGKDGAVGDVRGVGVLLGDGRLHGLLPGGKTRGQEGWIHARWQHV